MARKRHTSPSASPAPAPSSDAGGGVDTQPTPPAEEQNTGSNVSATPPAPSSDAGEPQEQAKPVLRKWQCDLDCPTPLRDKSLVVEAATDGEAREKFFAHNGITQSDHTFTCVLADE